MVNTNTRIPQSPFLDPQTQRPAREWMIYLQYPSVVGLNLSTPLGTTSGGTGTSASPTNGQLLIGNSGAYTVANLTAGTGISIANGPGSITINSSGVTSFSAGTTGLTPSTPTGGAVVLGGTLNVTNGGTGISSIPVGKIPFGNTATALQYTNDFFYFNNSVYNSAPGANSYRAFVANSTTAQLYWGVDTLNQSFINSQNDLVFYAGGGEKMRLKTTGAVSFGASGTAYGVAGQIFRSNGNASPVFEPNLFWDSTNKDFRNVTLSSNIKQSFTCLSNTASASLGFDAGNDGFVYSSNGLWFASNGTRAMTITTAGGVAFGTSATTYGSSGDVLVSSGNAAPTWKSLNYGFFAYNGTQAPAANTAVVISWGGYVYQKGMYIGGTTSRIYVSNTGYYNITIHLQLENTSATADTVIAWFKFNGNNQADTASRQVIAQGGAVLELSLIYNFNAGDYMEIGWLSVNGTSRLIAFGSSGSPSYPATLSASALISQIAP